MLGYPVPFMLFNTFLLFHFNSFGRIRIVYTNFLTHGCRRGCFLHLLAAVATEVRSHCISRIC